MYCRFRILDKPIHFHFFTCEIETLKGVAVNVELTSSHSCITIACTEYHNCGSPPMRIDATIGVAYYTFMAPMPQWELPPTKVEQAQRTVGL